MEKTHLAVIEFLCRHGAEEAARTFYDELDEKPEFDFDEVFRRKEIREAIEAGELKHALDLLNGYYPTIFIRQPDLEVDILVAQLVASARQGTDPLEVVTTARTELVPLIERFPKPEDRQQQLHTLNKAMSLLIRPDADPAEVWSPTSIYVSFKELARSIDTRISEGSGSKLRADALIFEHLIRIHQWASDKEEEERDRRVPL